MELVGDPMGLQLKEQVRASLKAHECSILNVAPNPSIRELSPWLRVSCWHELAVNHIIPAGTPLNHIKQASVLPTPMNREFNLDCLPSMVRPYLAYQAAGSFYRRFPRGHGGAQLALGAIHSEQILYANDQASHYDGPIQR
jgi:hypothetical protein